jgi:hypothetical protein
MASQFSPSFESKDSLLDPDPVASGSCPSAADFRFSPMRLFNVEGLIVVITGGGTGK